MADDVEGCAGDHESQASEDLVLLELTDDDLDQLRRHARGHEPESDPISDSQAKHVTSST
jgi:hypothetical protein